jgi:hypothetical protein
LFGGVFMALMQRALMERRCLKGASLHASQRPE